MEVCIGHVTHYYNHLGVAVLSLSSELNLNDFLHFSGHNTDFYQKNWSMQIEHCQIHTAEPDQEVAVKVIEPVHHGDQVFMVMEIEPDVKEDILLEQLRDRERSI